MKKRKRRAVSLLSAALLLAGCSETKGAGPASKFQDQETFLVMSNITDADGGVYYVESKEGYMVLKYVDKASAKETVLCQKVNCRHNSRECPAVAEENEYMGFLVYSDGKLYYMVSHETEKESGLSLYRMDKDGSNKTLVHEFQGQDTPPNGGGIYKGKVFLSLPTRVELEDKSGASSAEPSLVMYDLETKEEATLVDGHKEKGIYSVPCGGSGESVYFYQMSYHGESRGITYKQYDFKTKEISTAWEGSGNYPQIISHDTLYLWPEGEKRIEAYELKTKQKETVLEWSGEYSDVYVQPGFLQFVKREEEDGRIQEFYQWYDLKEKEYLFDELKAGTEIADNSYVSEGEMKVSWRLEDGRYWIQKNDRVYFYDPKDKSWTEIEIIS